MRQGRVGNSGTHFGTGTEIRPVTILSVNSDTKTATVRDNTGSITQIRMDVMRSKGMAPEAGESWLIDKTNGIWSFHAIIGYDGLTLPEASAGDGDSNHSGTGAHSTRVNGTPGDGYTPAIASADFSSSYGVAAEATGESSTAVGYAATTADIEASVFGTGSGTSGDYATSIGGYSFSEIYGAALGYSSTAYNYGTALGALASAIVGSNAVAVGYGTTASAVGAVALGSGATASGSKAIALGNNTTAQSAESIVIGQNATALTTATGAVVVGSGATAVQNGVAIGLGVAVGGVNAVGIGNAVSANGSAAVSMGYLSYAYGSESVAIGRSATTSYTAQYAVALGYFASAASTSVAIGAQASATGTSNTVVGPEATGRGVWALAMGYRALADDESVSIGRQAVAGGYNVAVGTNSGVPHGSSFPYTLTGTVQQAVAVGYAATVGASRGTAIGDTASTSGVDAVALGTKAQATGVSTVAIGAGSSSSLAARAQGARSIAIGHASQSSADDSVALGNTAVAAGLRSVAIGASASNSTDDTGLIKVDVLEVSPSSGGSASSLKLHDSAGASHLVGVTSTGITYDGAAVGGGSSYTDEQVRDVIGAALVAGSNVTIVPNDGADTITISATGYTDEQVRDVMGVALVAGTNVTIVPNDGADTITISATGGGSSYTDEQVRDVIGAALVAGSGITITPNDVGDIITIAATSSGSYPAASGTFSYGGSNPVVASAASSTVVAGTITPTVNGLLTVTMTAVANNTSGTQGAYIWPLLFANPTDTTPPASTAGSTQATQVVATPLTNAAITGKAVFAVMAGVAYELRYNVKAGSGGPTVTFSSLAASWATYSVNTPQGTYSNRMSSNITLNSSSWANVDTGTDLTLSNVNVGDLVEVSGSWLTSGSTVTATLFDAVSIVSGSPVNSWGIDGAVTVGGEGIQAWRCDSNSIGLNQRVGGGMARRVVSGDLVGGVLTLRLRYKQPTASNVTLYNDTTRALHFAATNLRA